MRASSRADTKRNKTPTNKGLKFPPEILTAEEVRRLLAVCGKGPAGKRNSALIAVFAGSGLRLQEAFDLMTKDLNEDEWTIRVLHGKGNKARTAALTNHVHSIRVLTPHGCCTYF